MNQGKNWQTTVSFAEEDLDWLDAEAKRLGCSRSWLIGTLIQAARAERKVDTLMTRIDDIIKCLKVIADAETE